MSQQKQEFFPSLEGIRAYAFFAVFFLHYNGVASRPTSLLLYPLYLLWNTTWFLVPIFFVLSGFLITRILLATKDREGYFKTFYFRRAVRVLPLYYLVIIPIGAVALVHHWPLYFRHLLYLVYLQNFTQLGISDKVDIGHLWSLAIEEQFYLLWPIAIWLLRTEQALLKFSYFFIIVCAVFRFSWPVWHISNNHAYYFTLNRVDGIILGAVLAIHYKRATHWDKFVKYSRIFIPAAMLSMLLVTILEGSTWPTTYVGIAFCIPVMNLIGLCFVILAINPSSFVAKACSGALICKFGRLSYGLYMLHNLYNPYFMRHILPRLAQHMPRVCAEWVTSFTALGLTIALAMLAYKFIEEPAIKLKGKFKYGPLKERHEIPFSFLKSRYLIAGAK